MVDSSARPYLQFKSPLDRTRMCYTFRTRVLEPLGLEFCTKDSSVRGYFFMEFPAKLEFILLNSSSSVSDHKLEGRLVTTVNKFESNSSAN